MKQKWLVWPMSLVWQRSCHGGCLIARRLRWEGGCRRLSVAVVGRVTFGHKDAPYQHKVL